MSMNINPISPGSVTAISATRDIQTSKIATPDKQPVPLPQDHATVTSVGDLVASALKQPEVRADRVSALREAVASGTYKVDPQAIASSMPADEL